jgi:DNA replication protein DnaC
MLPQDIKKQYDASRERAEEQARQRREEAYAAVPELRRIEDELKRVSFEMGPRLVSATDREAVRRETATRLSELYAKRDALLSENGKDAKSLLPRYSCEKCSDSGYLPGGELCPCARLKLAGRQYSSSGISEKAGFDRFDESLFKDPEQLKRTRRAAEICAQYAQTLEIGGARGLLLMGETGLGKTFLMDSIGREAIKQGRTVKKYTAYNLIDAALRSVRQREQGPDLTDVELLMIDDLGTEPMIPGVTIETLFAAINERQFAGKATIIATNLSKNELFTQYGERIFSRLFASREYAALTLKGKDLRI